MSMSDSCYDNGVNLLRDLAAYDEFNYGEEHIKLVLKAMWKLFTFTSIHDAGLSSIATMADHEANGLETIRRLIEDELPPNEKRMGLEETAEFHATRTYHITKNWVKNPS